jgi:polyphosphate kinase
MALVELKARFDEDNNIQWARQLERSGVHVVYGVIGLKTHTKITLVVRTEKEKLRSYCHIATGNYNSRTSTLYTDLGLLSARPELGQDLAELFNVRPAEIRSFLHGQLAPGRTQELHAQFLAAGLPV